MPTALVRKVSFLGGSTGVDNNGNGEDESDDSVGVDTWGSGSRLLDINDRAV